MIWRFAKYCWLKHICKIIFESIYMYMLIIWINILVIETFTTIPKKKRKRKKIKIMKKMFSDIFKLVDEKWIFFFHIFSVLAKNQKKEKKEIKIRWFFFKETLEKITNLNSYGTVLHRSDNCGNQLYNCIIWRNFRSQLEF